MLHCIGPPCPCPPYPPCPIHHVHVHILGRSCFIFKLCWLCPFFVSVLSLFNIVVDLCWLCPFFVFVLAFLCILLDLCWFCLFFVQALKFTFLKTANFICFRWVDIIQVSVSIPLVRCASGNVYVLNTFRCSNIRAMPTAHLGSITDAEKVKVK